MSEIIEGQAQHVIELSEEKLNNLTDAEKKQLGESIAKMENQVATQALQSEKGWDILNSMAKLGFQQVLATSPFVIPVLQKKEEILSKLKDPEGFVKQFTTMMSDIEAHSSRLNQLAQLHKGKSGAPTEDDHALLLSLANDYTDVMNNYDTVIEPVFNNLIDVVKNEYGTVLTVEVDKEQGDV